MIQPVDRQTAVEILEMALNRLRQESTKVNGMEMHNEIIITGTARTEAGESFIKRAATGRRTLTIIYTVAQDDATQEEGA